jgi:hypothetical protein
MSYWTIGKFADWLRGTKIIASGTSEEWSAWKRKAKANHPFRYWLTEDVLDSVEKFVKLLPNKINDVRYYLNNRFTSKTHALTSTLKRGQWHEFNERLLFCSFDSFVDHIEIENAWSHLVWSDKETRAKYKMPWWRQRWYTRWFMEWRSPEAAIAYLEWEMSLRNTEWYAETDPLYDTPTTQAIAAKEKWNLYYWWKHVRPHRVDVHEYCGWNAYCEERRLGVLSKGGELGDYIFDNDESNQDKERSRKILKDMDALEKQFSSEDEDMLIRLVKLRDSLWT